MTANNDVVLVDCTGWYYSEAGLSERTGIERNLLFTGLSPSPKWIMVMTLTLSSNYERALMMEDF